MESSCQRYLWKDSGMSKSSISISCIIPAYNVEKYIAACLDSILKQKIENIEIICVDDCSTDNTARIIRQYESLHKEVKYVFQDHSFAGTARNRGLELANGEYIHFMDADDIVVEGAYKAIYDIAIKLDADYIKGRSYSQDINSGELIDNPYFNLDGFDTETFGKIIKIEDYLDIFLYSARAPWMGLYRRRFIEEHDLKFLPFKCVNDRAFYAALLCSNPRTVLYDGYIAVHKVNNENSLSGSRNRPDNFCHYVEHMKSVPVLLELATDFMKDKILNNEIATFCHEYMSSEIETRMRYKDIISHDIIPAYLNHLSVESYRDLDLRDVFFSTGYMEEQEIDTIKKLNRFFENTGKLAIYGYGKMAKILLKYMSDKGWSDRVCVCVLTNIGDKTSFDPNVINYIGVKDYYDQYGDLPILITTTERYQIEIIEEIRTCGIQSEVCVLTDNLLSEIERSIT